MQFVGAVRRQVREAFREDGMDIANFEIESIARDLVEMAAVDVAEIYTPPRFTPKCSRYGLRPGFVVDLTTRREDGEYWDLSREEDQEELERVQAVQEPYLLIGSPPCTDFCGLLRLSKSELEIERRLEQ
eukprot:11209057-Lingulodinium_polyedra.AAC.1